MKTTQKILVVMLIALLTGFQLNPQKDTEEEKVQAAIGNFFQSIEKYDYDGIRNACTGDFVIFENGVRMSCEDFIGFLKNYENMGAEMMNYQLDKFTAEVKGRNAWVTLDNKGTGRMGEQRLEFNWLESAILKKEKGDWKIAFYHSTEKPKPKPDLEKEQAAIEKCLDNISKAYARKDIELLSEIIAPGDGLCLFGTDEAEKWTDHSSFVESQRRWFENVEETRFIIKERSIFPDPTGTYARFYQIADFEGTSMGKPFKAKNTRMSGILEKQNGRWVMVQWHGSVPVSGQMVKY